MLIGIDASRANREHKTGTEWYGYYLIKSLAKLDKKNKYILYVDQPLKDGLLDLTNIDPSEHKNVNNKNVVDKNGYQTIKSSHNNFQAKVLKWPWRFFWTQGRMSLEMLLHPPDVLFVPSHTLPIIHPKKSIVTIHDIGFEKDYSLYEKEEMGSVGRKSGAIINLLVKIFTFGKYKANTIDYLRWSTEYALKKARKVLTVSNFSKKEMVEFFHAEEDKIKVVYNGYNKDLYKKQNDVDKISQTLIKYGIEAPYIFYVGRIEKKKNIPCLIESFAFLREDNKNIFHKLVLAGDASFGYDEVNYVLAEFDLEEDVIIPGWVEEEDMSFLFSGADAFVFPSNYEGFGIPLLQAMACEAPIVASNIPSLVEVAEDAALFFDQSDKDSMADALKEIILNKKMRERLIEAGRKRVKNFSWEKCAAETLKEIESL
ncbi:MAG: glycosyltransferase family 1 protein [bacterium]